MQYITSAAGARGTLVEISVVMGTSGIPTPTASERVYIAIRNDMLAGRFSPGARLTERQLVAAYRVSRTPVREALRRLAQEGLVLHLPHRGVLVRTFSYEEALHIYQVRIPLEGLAARLAAAQVTPHTVGALSEALSQAERAAMARDREGMALANHRFHDAIARASNNQALQQLLGHLRGHIALLRVTLWRAIPYRPLQTIRQHRRILQAIARGNPDLAERRAVEHLESSWATLQAVLARTTRIGTGGVR
ncbi:MAG: GntR family transcriptional regulator [Armatimonadota bacterium]|nr:GntR family transcriptional regulator [Armatimonadota bacterium]